MTWDQLLAMDLAGRDISFYGMEPAYYEARGPIAQVEDLGVVEPRSGDGEMVRVTCLWRNKRTQGAGCRFEAGTGLGTTNLGKGLSIKRLYGQRIAVTDCGQLMALIHSPGDNIPRIDEGH